MIFLAFAAMASLGGLILFSELPKDENPKLDELYLRDVSNFEGFEENRNQLDQFVSQFMMPQGLVVTNLLTTAQTDLASGEDLLSESVGLLLLYYLETNQQSAFDNQFTLAATVLQKSNNLFQWRTRENQPQTVNASVDDLRIMKALLMAEDQWGDSKYRDEAKKISKALLDYCTQDGWLMEQDSEESLQAKAFYYDFKAMYLAQSLDASWATIIKNGLKLTFKDRDQGRLNFSKISGNPAYYPTTENLLIYWHLTEVGYKDSGLNLYLREQMATGLYGDYGEDGLPLENLESPSIYSLAALVAKQTDDQILYELACKRMAQMQVSEDHRYKGGFVDVNDEEAYSFDQLLGLLAY